MSMRKNSFYLQMSVFKILHIPRRACLSDFASLSILIHNYYKEATTGPTQISANDKQKETDIISLMTNNS